MKKKCASLIRYTILTVVLVVFTHIGRMPYLIQGLKNIIIDDFGDIVLHYNDSKIKEISTFDTVLVKPDQWYEYKIIAHGGGGINGKLLSNSAESLNLHYNNGTRLFDVDISKTTEGVMVLRHSWKDNLEQTKVPHFKSMYKHYRDINQDSYTLTEESAQDITTFKSQKIYGMFTGMTVKELSLWMNNHPDAYILPDFKGNLAIMLKEFLAILEKEGGNECVKHVVARFSDKEQYDAIAKIVARNRIMWKNYHTHRDSYRDILSFCVQKQICGVLLTMKDVNTEIIQEFTNKGIHVYAGCIDYLSDFRYFEEKGCWGAVSNFLFENEIIN